MYRLLLIVVVTMMCACADTTHHSPLVNNYSIVASGDIQSISFGSYFAWHPLSGEVYSEQEKEAQELASQFHVMIVDELETKGYIFTHQSNKADILIRVALAREPQLSDQQILDVTHMSTGATMLNSRGQKQQKGSMYISFYNQYALQPVYQSLIQRPIPNEQKYDVNRSSVVRALKLIPEAKTLSYNLN